MNIIGLDIGTTGCKAILFNVDGTLIARTYREYNVDIPNPRWCEQNLEKVWLLAQEAISEVVIISQVKEIKAIGLSVHGEAITPVDEGGRSIRPTILGMDARTWSQNDWLRERIGSEAIFARTGMPIHTINTLPKLMWIKENEPEVWKTANKFLLVEDFFIQKMTGEVAISLCLASRTQLCDLQKGTWSDEILSILGLDPARLATIKPSGTAIGVLSKELSTRFGLSNRPQVVTGGHDQACGALGAGLTSPGLASVSTGTAEVVEVALPSPLVSEPLFEGNISVYHHVVPGLFLAMTLNHSGGMALRWFRDELCEPQVHQSAQDRTDAYDLILSGVSAEPSSLLVLPHFAGSGTPTIDTASKAAILGLTFATTRSTIAKAILEGLTYELRMNLDILKEGGVQIDALRAIGGGAKSPLWLQLKADITGIPVLVPNIKEASGFGAAILAGVGIGLFPSAADAAKQFLEFTSEYYPDPDRKSIYDRQYDLYQQIYSAISPITHQL
jgi:xylulokinase